MEEVQRWLQSLELLQYSSKFQEEGYDNLKVISCLSEEELTQLGVKPGHRKKILLYFEEHPIEKKKLTLAQPALKKIPNSLQDSGSKTPMTNTASSLKQPLKLRTNDPGFLTEDKKKPVGTAPKSLQSALQAKESVSIQTDIPLSKLKKVKAFSDYKATELGELSFREGDIIAVIEEHPTGWWKGELKNGNTGLFPCNHVEDYNGIDPWLQEEKKEEKEKQLEEEVDSPVSSHLKLIKPSKADPSSAPIPKPLSIPNLPMKNVGGSSSLTKMPPKLEEDAPLLPSRGNLGRQSTPNLHQISSNQQNTKPGLNLHEIPSSKTTEEPKLPQISPTPPPSTSAPKKIAFSSKPVEEIPPESQNLPSEMVQKLKSAPKGFAVALPGTDSSSQLKAAINKRHTVNIDQSLKLHKKQNLEENEETSNAFLSNKLNLKKVDPTSHSNEEIPQLFKKQGPESKVASIPPVKIPVKEEENLPPLPQRRVIPKTGEKIDPSSVPIPKPLSIPNLPMKNVGGSSSLTKMPPKLEEDAPPLPSRGNLGRQSTPNLHQIPSNQQNTKPGLNLHEIPSPIHDEVTTSSSEEGEQSIPVKNSSILDEDMPPASPDQYSGDLLHNLKTRAHGPSGRKRPKSVKLTTSSENELLGESK